ncbi:MAG: lipoyl(octanoyl) transferase [Chloroflexi bacterium]|nr:lipoyl(octanoyl) transferase [Chloroflexota bacterium]|tara:strand:- start:7850 stop:8560 length:711 start_codon:yes stop_codon:yes gene_type:complete
MTEIRFNDFGETDYLTVYNWMQNQRINISLNKSKESINFVEHPSVFTLGTNAELKNVLINEDNRTALNIDLVHVDRGGDVTCHNKGQLVAYPLLNLKKRNLKPVEYVRMLENILINVLKKYNISGIQNPGTPGIWVGNNKIASIGISIKKGITSHGISLNINNDLNIFNYINTCGIQDLEVTSMNKILNKTVDVQQIKLIMMKEFQSLLGLQTLNSNNEEVLLKQIELGKKLVRSK